MSSEITSSAGPRLTEASREYAPDVTAHALNERTDFARTLRATPPGAPTLCGDWTAAVLTAHLVQRERSLSEGLGRLPVRALRRFAEDRLRELAETVPYAELVDRFEAGPPSWSPMGVPAVREALNLLEYVVHHEDVRRAQPDFAPRLLPVNRQRAIWQRLRRGAPFTMRAVPIGVRLRDPEFGDIDVHPRRGTEVTVTGPALELALVAFGRQRVAKVSYEGAPDRVGRLTGARIPI
jgi:uncharacterized protein (TIGR03085 family)